MNAVINFENNKHLKTANFRKRVYNIMTDDEKLEIVTNKNEDDFRLIPTEKPFEITITLFLIFFASQKILAGTHYVSKTGSHISPFTSWGNAATNIQAAVDAASSNDTVLVNDGTYYPTNELRILKTLILKSVNGASKTIINGSAAHRCLYIESNNTNIVDGFTITNGRYDGYSKYGGGINCYKGIIESCVIKANIAKGGYGGGLKFDYSTIDNCIIIENKCLGNGGGIFCCNDGTVKNCTIIANYGQIGGGVYCESYGYGKIIENCIFISNSASYGGAIYSDHLRHKIKNCIIYYNTANNEGDNYYNYAPNYISFEYCCMPDFANGTSIITNIPQFQDKYHLASTSPCIDRGISEYWMKKSFDYYGNKRIANDFVDIGAHEYPLPEIDIGTVKEDWWGNTLEIIQTNETYNFGVIRSNNTRTSTLIITNRGSASLNLISTPKIQIGGNNFDDFKIVEQPEAIINTNSSCNFKIKFDPPDISSGTSSAYIVIANNDRNENPYKIFLEDIWDKNPTGIVTTVANITGNGTENDPFNLGYVLIDHYTYAYLKLNIKNASTYNLDINWIEGSDNFDCYNLEPSINENDSDVFSVEFKSYSTNEIETAKFAIKDDDFTFTEFYVKARLVEGDLLPPDNVNATDRKYNDRVVVTWSNVVDATAYDIYRSISNDNASLVIIATISSNIYTDLTVTPGIRYYYKIKSSGIPGESILNDSESGYALVTSSEPKKLRKWKYKSKNGKSKLNVNGLGMTAPLANYLEDGCLVGLKDASSYETVDGPRKLESKKKKNGDIKFWFYNEKKVAIIKYKPNDKKPEKDKLIYKVWKDLPTEIIFFVQTPVESNGVSNTSINIIKPVYELIFTPNEKIKNEWRELKKE